VLFEQDHRSDYDDKEDDDKEDHIKEDD